MCSLQQFLELNILDNLSNFRSDHSEYFPTLFFQPSAGSSLLEVAILTTPNAKRGLFYYSKGVHSTSFMLIYQLCHRDQSHTSEVTKPPQQFLMIMCRALIPIFHYLILSGFLVFFSMDQAGLVPKQMTLSKHREGIII